MNSVSRSPLLKRSKCTYNKLGDVHPTAATTDQLAIVRHLRSGHGYTGPADKSLAVLHNVHEYLHG